MGKLRIVVSTVLCKAGAWRVHIGFTVMDDAVKLPPSRNGSQIVLSLNTNIFYATSVTVQWVGISYRGVSIARVADRPHGNSHHSDRRSDRHSIPIHECTLYMSAERLNSNSGGLRI